MQTLTGCDELDVCEKKNPFEIKNQTCSDNNPLICKSSQLLSNLNE